MDSLARVPAPTDYPHVLPIVTRWKDNDVYGHVNNVEYYSYFDTVINAWLIREGGLDIHAGEVIGLCVESHCEYRAALTFPETIEVGLRVGRLGKSSVRYELAVFRAGGVIGLCAESHCTYSAALAFPETVRAALRVGRLGRSSVRYEIGLFREGGELAAEGWFVHVFVDRVTRRPTPPTDRLRAALEALA